jgi:hypothetical protein
MYGSTGSRVTADLIQKVLYRPIFAGLSEGRFET